MNANLYHAGMLPFDIANGNILLPLRIIDQYLFIGRRRMDTFIESFNEYRVAWMLVFFVGVLFWAFRARFRRPPK